MAEHVPASLHFTSLSYTLNSHLILDSISGSALPGQVMAIMGASGTGKSTFLDILARKNKRGQVKGETRVNGQEVGNEEFVDQEDTLMGTLTVYESMLCSMLPLKLAILTIECHHDPFIEMKKYPQSIDISAAVHNIKYAELPSLDVLQKLRQVSLPSTSPTTSALLPRMTSWTPFRVIVTYYPLLLLCFYHHNIQKGRSSRLALSSCGCCCCLPRIFKH